jgi:hypothetical protein
MADNDKDKDEKQEVTTPKPGGNGAIPAIGRPQIDRMPKKT